MDNYQCCINRTRQNLIDFFAFKGIGNSLSSNFDGGSPGQSGNGFYWQNTDGNAILNYGTLKVYDSIFTGISSTSWGHIAIHGGQDSLLVRTTLTRADVYAWERQHNIN